jgi:hypothetical protein
MQGIVQCKNNKRFTQSKFHARYVERFEWKNGQSEKLETAMENL